MITLLPSQGDFCATAIFGMAWLILISLSKHKKCLNRALDASESWQYRECVRLRKDYTVMWKGSGVLQPHGRPNADRGAGGGGSCPPYT